MDTKTEIRLDDDLHKTYKRTAAVGVAILASLFIYAIIIELIKKQFSPFTGFAPMPDATISVVRYGLLGVATIEFFIIRTINKVMLSANHSTGIVFSQRLMTTAVVTFALCESVALFGLVLFLLQGATSDFYLFLVVSLLYFSIFFPRYSAWEAWVKEKQQPRGR